KCFIKPINKFFISIGDLYIGLKVRNFCDWITTKVSNINASFSINNASKISKISLIVFFWCIFTPIIHSYSYVLYGNSTIQNNIKVGQPQRLSLWDRRNAISDSLNYMETYRGKVEVPSPLNRKYLVTKSNRKITICQNEDPVLNEAAARLGVSLDVLATINFA